MISKTVCALMAVGVLVLLILAIVATYFLVPLAQGHVEPNDAAAPLRKASIFPGSAGTKQNTEDPPEVIHQRLPRSIRPTHYRLVKIIHKKNHHLMRKMNSLLSQKTLYFSD